MKPTLFILCFVVLLHTRRPAAAVDSPAPNWLYRTNMAVETAAERPYDDDPKTFLMTSIPPDTQGAVSPEQQVTATNDIVRVFDRGRKLLGWNWMYTWWKDHNTTDPLAEDRTYFDPRVCYDPVAQRWYSYASSYTDRDSLSDSAAHLAVSLTKDFLGEWRVWTVKTTDLGAKFSTKWFDQPRLGFGAGMVAVAVTMLQRSSPWGDVDEGETDSPKGMAVIVLSDLSNQPSGLQGTLTTFSPNTFPFSNTGVLCPAATYGSNTRLYMVSVHNYGLGLYAFTALRKSNGVVVADKNFATVDAIGGFTISNLPSASGGGYVPQNGSSYKLEVKTGVVENACYRNGSLWFTQCVYGKKNAADTATTHAHWMRVALSAGNSTPSVQGEGLVGSPSVWLLYPSICANKNNDALLGYTQGSSSTYPSAAYSFRYGTDSANTMQNGRIFATGQSVHYEVFTGSRNRWGDYSATVVDPSDDTALMTLQEYSETASPDPPAGSDWDEYPDRFGLMWGRVGGTAVPEITSQPVSLTVAPGANATFTCGAGFDDGATRQWYRDGVPVGGLQTVSSSITITTVDASDLGLYQCKLTSAGGLVLWSNTARLKLTTGAPGLFNLTSFSADGDGFYDATEQPAQFVFLAKRIYVSRTNGTDGEVPVTVRFRDPNASSAPRGHDGWDFTAKEVTLTFPAGSSATQSVIIPTLNDTMVEGDGQRFTVEIEIADSSSGAAVGDWDQATILIDDNDTAPSLATALDGSGLTWTSTIWRGQTTTTNDGVDAAQTDWCDPNTDNDISTTVTGPGTMLFRWRMTPVSLGGRLAIGDSLRVLLDGVTQETYDPSRGSTWYSDAVTIPSGTHTLVWRFHRGSGVESATKKATAFLDRVSYYTGTAGVIEFSSAGTTINESTGTASLFVKRWGSTATGQFTLTLTPQTATASDYGSPAVPVTLAAGATSATVSIPIVNDAAAEPAENFLVTLGLPVGSPLKIGPQSSTTVTIADDDAGTYGAWRLAKFTAAEAASDVISGPLADPDKDGVINLHEFGFDGPPKIPDTSVLPQAGVLDFGGLTYTTVTFRRPIGIKGINYTVQRASGLAAWEDGSSYGPVTDSPLTPATDEVSRDGTPVETIVVQDNTPQQSSGRSFLRVMVTLQ
jgi:hypothetical protein